MKKKFDIQKAREAIKKKYKRLSDENHKRFENAWQDFNKIVEMIIKKYNPDRIYQWGSLLKEKHFSEISDIDIGVEGVTSAEKFFAMFGDSDKLTDFPLDMLQIEKIEQVHAEDIRSKGRLVYEKE